MSWNVRFQHKRCWIECVCVLCLGAVWLRSSSGSMDLDLVWVGLVHDFVNDRELLLESFRLLLGQCE
jgi:hypothetical protein